MVASTQLKQQATLHRELGVLGATMMGLGSIVGTGIFVSISIAAGAAGPAVILAVTLAAVVAACNGLSSAELAAGDPVSGGTYEYGYRWLHPSLGFVAGWLFVCAKTASAATAALGFSGYMLNVLGRQQTGPPIPLALIAVVVLTVLTLSGLRRSNMVNIVIVSLTLLSLASFVIAGLPTAARNAESHLTRFFDPSGRFPQEGFLEACALMFVAYTGYGRIATMGEEIRAPRKNIPRAMVATLVASMALYIAVATVAVAAVGTDAFYAAGVATAAPLEVVAREFSFPYAATAVAVGAMTAMLGVLLNLILGLSRVVLAMGRRGDIPKYFAKLDASESTPWPAVIVSGLLTSGLVLVGNVKTTWSFSAFTVLIYYAITNMAALRMEPGERLYPRSVAWAGLVSCLFLAFWVQQMVWIVGLSLLGVGFLWWYIADRLRKVRA